MSGDRSLGMDRAITRRDFLQGVALGAGALALGGCPRSSQAPAPPAPPPPASPSAGAFRGQDAEAMKLGHWVRDRLADEGLPADATESGERYDLVVVGAGLAGLAAAYAWHREKKGRTSILILDAHDEIGGHARRNEFEWNGATLIAHGGTFALESPGESPPEVARMLREVGVDPERMKAFRDRSVFERLKLSTGVYFDARVFGGPRSGWVGGFYETPYEAFFAGAPIPADARKDLIELYTTRRDYLPGLAAEEREERLAAMSWEAFIRDRMKLGPAAVRFADLYAQDLVGLGADAISAAAGAEVGPGFAGMAGAGFEEDDGLLVPAYDAGARYPDGNHTIARLFLRAILPEAFPDAGGAGAEPDGVFLARFDRAALDRPGRAVRVRLRSMAVRIEDAGPAGAVVHVRRPDGRVSRVRAGGAVMAGWGMVAKHIVPGLDEAQRRALGEYRYAAAVYVNVLLRHWRPIADLGLHDMVVPGGPWTAMMVSDPLRVGRYRPDYDPSKPTVLSVHKYLHKPGLDPTEQMKLSRVELETTPFEVLERQVREELMRMLGPAGFKPADDILAITINRWGHGYCFFSAPGGPRAPWERGRTRAGRIAFAGADAGGIAWTQAALEQGRRAALELI